MNIAKTFIIAAVICSLLGVAGCAADGAFQHEESLDNKGTVCVKDNKVRVDFQTCLSSSCDTLEGALCVATMQGESVVVTSTATRVTKGNTCTSDCGFARVTCDLPSGADKATTVIYGGSSKPIDTLCNAF